MKILLVADVKGWAFDRDAHAVQQYLTQYDISVGYSSNFNDNALNKYDHVHFMNWLDGQRLAKKISAGVSSHNYEFLHKADAKASFPKYQGLIAVSKILYDRIKDSNENVFYAPGGVHEDLFTYHEKPPEKEFVVGWTGQRTRGGLNLSEDTTIDIKGFGLIMKPLMERFASDPEVKFKLITNNYKDAIPYDKMPQEYRDVDCQICTSIAEGAPNPMFEAASSGKALISTKVGAISELIEHGRNGFIIDAYRKRKDLTRVIHEFEMYIRRLKVNRDLCREMGINNRSVVEEKWGWKKTVQRWIPLFEHIRQIKGV